MATDILDHLLRIESCVGALARLPWWDVEDSVGTSEVLLDFDSNHWSFLPYVSLGLYEELTGLLHQDGIGEWMKQKPSISVVIPVHEASETLLRSALKSVKNQIGVSIECLISVDGSRQDLELVRQILFDLGPEDQDWKTSVYFSDVNRGVGMCRNRALREVETPWFTFLDDDDLFHPLRCLHGLILMSMQNVLVLNTSWCRVSMMQKKIVLINGRIVCSGMIGLIARSEILSQYGYFAELRHFEDAEYAQRLAFFGVPMFDSGVVGHYCHTEPIWEYKSLGTGYRKEVHSIEGHPYICGSVVGEMTDECKQLESQFQARYRHALASALHQLFPGT